MSPFILSHREYGAEMAILNGFFFNLLYPT